MARPSVLTADRRKIIEEHWGAGWTQAEIARAVCVAPSTISRELRRYHSAQHGVKNPLLHRLPKRRRAAYRRGYRAEWAQGRAQRARRRPKPAKLAQAGTLRELVLTGLGLRWSPRQISAWLANEVADQPQLQVSHETIYQAIYVQSRGNLRAELAGQVALRSGRARRKPQSREAGAGRGGNRRPWIGELRIAKRPPEANDRAVPGHWEGDLLVGARGSSAIVTLAERSTRFVLLGALPDGRDSSAVIEVLSRLAQRLPGQLWRSLTWDQGTEMAQHAAFTVATGCPVYFCDPHSPWQRGTNENTNGLLRQYFPKGSFDFRTIDQDGLDEVAWQLNTRPRMTLGWQTPIKRLNEMLAARHL